MRKVDLYVSSALLVTSALGAIWLIPASIAQSKDASFQPSLVPQVTAAFIAILSAVLLWQSIRKEEDTATPFGPVKLPEFLFVAGSLTAAFLLVLYLGFFIGGAATIAGYMVWARERRPFVVLGLSVGVAGVAWFVLSQLLKIPLV